MTTYLADIIRYKKESYDGAEEIALERSEQIKKHGKTVESDAAHNEAEQLRSAAIRLLAGLNRAAPHKWDRNVWKRMSSKPYRDRLIIAGALIAAEIDRIDYIGKTQE